MAGFSWLLKHLNEKQGCNRTSAEESDQDRAGVSAKLFFLHFLDGGNCPSQSVKYCLLRQKSEGMIALFSGGWVGSLVSSHKERHWSDSDNVEKGVKASSDTECRVRQS